MKIFLSWSGDVSKEVAEVLRKYLPIMLQGTDVFLSKHDLPSGVRWVSEVAKELSESNFGIVCLTPDNLTAPWIIFEAGALSKQTEGRACCLLLGGLNQADVRDPLSQFQNRVFCAGEFQQLLYDINDATDRPLDGKSLGILLAKFWPDIESSVKDVLGKSQPPIEPPRREIQDLIEEVLVRVRNLEASQIKRERESEMKRVADLINPHFRGIPGSFPGGALAELVEQQRENFPFDLTTGLPRRLFAQPHEGEEKSKK